MNSSEKLKRVLERDWHASLEEEPELATQVGVPDHDHRWSDLSREAIESRKSRKRETLRELQSIPREGLSPGERLSHDLLTHLLAEAIEGQQFPEELLPIDNLRGVAETVPRTIAMMPDSTPAELERIAARLEGVPALVEQTIALMDEGIAAGVTQARPALERVPGQLERQTGASVSESPLMAPFRDASPALAERAARSIELGVFPAFERLRRYLVERYIPASRAETAWSALPDGEAWYAFKARASTTTPQTPRELHELGLEQVERVRSQMAELTREAGFGADFAAFRAHLRSDPRYFFDSAQALLAAYRDVCKRIEPCLVKLFGRLPWLPVGVAPVPEHLQRSGPVAYYQSGSVPARRPGWFYANTYDLQSRPRWEMDVLTLHEAVPGHHLQIALALEMEDLPEFRKWSFLDAYVEGWALYAESLGEELGLYRDPSSRMGRLSYDALRSCRLVVDTGLHVLGWSRQKALDYLLANSCEAPHDVVVEIDRYIGMPGQALSYKAGELAIQRLRRRAVSQMGERFDLRAFHDTVLGQGPLPLDMLELQVEEWMRGKATA